MQEKRLAKLEAGLDPREKVLAWLHANQQQGGFVELATRRIETNGAAVRLPEVEDVESAFLYACSGECNLCVLRLQETHLEQAFLWLCVARFLDIDHIPPEDLIELQCFRELVKLFVLQWMLLDRAIHQGSPLRLGKPQKRRIAPRAKSLIKQGDSYDVS